MFKFKQTKAQAHRSKKLANVVSKGRSFIKGKRKEETRILATLEVARDIISDKNFWVQGRWFDAGISNSKPLVDGEDIDSYQALKYAEEEYECSLEDKVCKVCAEGAIYLAADTIIDGSIAINAIDEALEELNHQAFLEREKEELEKAKSGGKNPDDYRWYNWEYSFEYPYYNGSIQEINDQGKRSTAHKNTLKAFDDAIAHLKKKHKVK